MKSGLRDKCMIKLLKKKKDFHSDEVQEVLLSFENMDNKEEFGGKGGVSVSS